VAVKWFLPEVDDTKALAVLDEFEPIAPDWLLIEVANVLDRRRRDREITQADCRTAVGFLRHAIELRPSAGLVGAAQDLAAERSLTVYDAIYLALALDEGLRLVTADRRLASADSRRGVTQWLGQ
jgi:predicted nucleic acid-binding protein